MFDYRSDQAYEFERERRVQRAKRARQMLEEQMDEINKERGYDDLLHYGKNDN